ncbi:MAG: arginine--tRNA ligase [Candidatus Rokubacteria bacterium 13_1_40CM_4_69_5]|nr:MAG: arginine--tRNA ligase [Candidatus Rokubacteria bacterium 13_1_40CM_4_69_5]
MSMSKSLTERLTEGVRTALAKAGLPEPEACLWEVPRQTEHGDYATNTAMVLAKTARRSPRQIAELIVKHFPPLPEVERLEVAGPGFLNVVLSAAWCAQALRDILAAGAHYGRGESLQGTRIRLEFVSANPTGPLVIVNGRAAAVGDSLARLLRAQSARVTTEYYINDAGTQFEALARSFEARVRQALGDDAPLPENGYPGEYLIELAAEYLKEQRIGTREELEARLAPHATGEGIVEHFGRWAVARIVDRQRAVLRDYGAEFDLWTSEQRDVRGRHLPEKALEELAVRGLTHEHEGALWFRSPEFGDDKDRVLRRSTGELTYFAVDLANHHYLKFSDADRVIDLFGPDHHGYVPRLRAAMDALGHPPGTFEVLIVQLVTLLRDGQPVRMSKRRGEFVLMEELLEEVGRDAARFTFLTRRHDSPLEFDLGLATRQSTENPVYYVQYAHARIRSIWKQVAEQGIRVPPWSEIDLSALTLPEERALMKRLVQYPALVAGAAHALEPHRVAYWLGELAGLFHPYYKSHRVIQPDQGLMFARLALCTAVGQVLHSGLDLLGVSAPESM